MRSISLAVGLMAAFVGRSVAEGAQAAMANPPASYSVQIPSVVAVATFCPNIPTSVVPTVLIYTIGQDPGRFTAYVVNSANEDVIAYITGSTQSDLSGLLNCVANDAKSHGKPSSINFNVMNEYQGSQNPGGRGRENVMPNPEELVQIAVRIQKAIVQDVIVRR